MAARWFEASKDGTSFRFVPRFVPLEDRCVPATYYVDPRSGGGRSGTADGATVTFDQGHANETPNLHFANSAASAIANPTFTAFADFRVALDAAELNPGPDTILLATGQIDLDNRAVTFDLGVNAGFVNSVPVSQALTLRGDGAGATIVTPIANTQFDNGTGAKPDDATSLFRVDGAGAVLTASNFRLDGNSRKVGSGFSVQNGASAAFDGVTVSGIAFEPTGPNTTGAAVVGSDAKSLTFANGTLSNYGRNGILFSNTPGSVSNSSVLGRGFSGSRNNAVELQSGSVVSLTGNRIADNAGVFVGLQSIGLLVSDDGKGANPSQALAVGNTFTGNTLAVHYGGSTLDSSTLDAAYNTIAGNAVGVSYNLAINPQDLANNWWGSPTGPFNQDAPGTGKGDAIVFGNTKRTAPAFAVSPFLSYPTPQLAPADVSSFAAAQGDYLRLVTTLGVAVNPVGPASLTAAPASVSFTVTVPVPVAANTVAPAALRPLQASDFVVTGPAGFTTALTGSGTSYTLTVGGLTGTNYAVTAALPARAAIDPATGFLTAASNAATVSVAVPTPLPTPNADPTVTPIADQFSGLAPRIGPLDFTVGDDAPLTELVLTAASSDDTVVPAAGIVFGGTGANRTVTLTGLPGKPGVSTVTLSVADAQGLVTTRSFAVSVVSIAPPPPPANAAPTVTPIADQAVPTGGTTGPLGFTVGDDSTPAAGLAVTVISSNAAVVPASSVTLGGTGANRTVTLANLPGTPGASAITVRVTDAGGLVTTTSFGVTVTSPPFLPVPVSPVVVPVVPVTVPPVTVPVVPVTVPPVTVPPVVAPKRTRLFAVAADAGGLPEVQVFGADGKPKLRFLAFDARFTGGVRVATADFDGDGTDDIVVAAGPGGGPHVRVVSGATGAELASFFAYAPGFRGGVTVAAADLTGTGVQTVVTGAGAGGGPHVKVFALDGTALRSFFAFDPAFTGGVNVAAGDLNGDGQDEIVAAAGPGGGPRVTAFSFATGSPVVVRNAFAFDAGFRGGVFVAAGTFGVAVAQGVGGASEVRVLDGGGKFSPYGAGFTGGVRLAAFDLGGDGSDEIVTAAGPGGGPHVQAFTAAGAPVFNAFAFDKQTPTGYFIG